MLSRLWGLFTGKRPGEHVEAPKKRRARLEQLKETE